MTVNVEFNGARGSWRGLLVLTGMAMEHNFPDYSVYLIIAAAIFLGISVRIDR